MATITMQYIGGTSSDVTIFPPLPSTVNVGSSILSTISNPNGTRQTSIHHIEVEMNGVDVTNLLVVGNTNKGYTYGVSWEVTGDIVFKIYFDNNPSVTYNLEDCTYSLESTTSVNWGSVIGFNNTGEVVADSGFDLHNAVVSVLIGQDDVTSQVWSNPPAGTYTQLLTTPPVTGDVVISIKAIATNLRFITYNLTDCISTNTDTEVDNLDSYSTILQKPNNYRFTSVVVTMGDVDITASVYNSTTNAISIPEVTGNVVITAVAEVITHSVTYNLTNCNSTNTATSVNEGSTYTTTLVNELGYDFTLIRITLGGVDVTSTAYNSETNIVTLEVTDDIVITASSSIGVIAINLYENSSESNRVDKSQFLTTVGTITGVLKDITSVTSPSIIIERNSIDFNYVKIPSLNRYYFVEEVVFVKYNLWQVRLKVDVLMSYSSLIKQQVAFVGRNQYTFHEDLIDSERIVNNNPIIQKYEYSTPFFNPDGELNRIVANVIGGN